MTSNLATLHPPGDPHFLLIAELIRGRSSVINSSVDRNSLIVEGWRVEALRPRAHTSRIIPPRHHQGRRA
jgi:hypothetical protein